MKKLIIALLLISVTFTSWSGKNFEGEVTYKITYKDVPEEMQMYIAMMPSKAKITLKNNWSKFEQSMGMMGDMAVMTNSKTKKSITLMNMMGQKMAIENSDSETVKIKYKKVERTKEKKKIAGYKCFKIIITDSTDVKTDIWVTKKIQAASFSGISAEVSEGFVMQYTTKAGEMTMVITADKVEKKKINEDTFSIPKGYEKKTQKEFEEIMKSFKM